MTTSSMSVPAAGAGADVDGGVLTTTPLELNCGSMEVRLVVPAGSGSSSTVTCES